jgi:protein-tyrosine phosphatase
LKRILNFRDFKDGTENSSIKIKDKMIFRSGHPDNLNSKTIKAMGIKTIIDLRGIDERKNSKIFQGSKTINLPIDYESRIKDKIKSILYSRNTVGKILNIIKNEYINLIELEKKIIKQVFDVLENEDAYPVIIHCRAGKDRTGFIIAIILMSLGLENEIVINNYLLSNEYILFKAKKFLNIISALSLGLVYTKNIEYLLTSHIQNINLVLDIISEKYKGIKNYLDSCGISEKTVVKIKKILLMQNS